MHVSGLYTYICICTYIYTHVYNTCIYVKRTPHPVIVTLRDNKDYIKVLFFYYYTTITGWGLLLIYMYICRYVYIYVCICIRMCICIFT